MFTPIVAGTVGYGTCQAVRLMFSERSILPAATTPLRGVNLGGWLVLEKWMTPSLFASQSATDEYTFCEQAGKSEFKKLQKFRDSFITEADFKWLHKQGIGAVRLPVGYWVFGDEPPYQGTIKYVDKVFDWATKHNIKVLVGLHGAPGSQNGWDHSGRSGVIGWHTDPANIPKTLSVIERLARRYGKHQQLLGISLLNEPKPSVPKKVLMDYYQQAYAIVRRHCGSEAWVVIHDNFRPRRWRRELRSPGYQNVYIDTHHYQCFSKRDKRHDIAWHLKRATTALPRQLQKLGSYHPVIVGEWSLALDRASIGKLNDAQDDALRRAYAAAQLLAYSHTRAWFFWSYKTEKGGAWSYLDSVERGWLPASWK